VKGFERNVVLPSTMQSGLTMPSAWPEMKMHFTAELSAPSLRYNSRPFILGIMTSVISKSTGLSSD
jgi:hypothetical protein